MPKPNVSSLQLPVDVEMEKLIVETGLDFFRQAQDARLKRDWGQDSKGVIYTYEQKRQVLTDLYYGKRPVKTLPWRNCSNRSMKITMSIIEMLHARMFAAVWNEDLNKWRAGEFTDQAKVDRITKLMDWWTRVHTRMRGFYDKWVKVCLAYGDVFTETTWKIDQYDTGERDETPVTDEFDNPLYEKDGTPSIVTNKKLKQKETTKVEIISSENVYLQENQTELEEDPVIIKHNWKFFQLEQMEREGKAVNVSVPLHPDNKTLRDYMQEKVDEATSSSDNEDNIAVLREVKLRNMPIDVIKLYIKVDIDDDGFAEDVRVLIDPLHRVYLGGVAVKDLTNNGKRPLDVTKINDRVDEPDSLIGYGYMEMIQPLAEEVDAIFNQLTDSNTLSILRPGFYDPSGSLQPQNITLAPNKLIPVSDPQRNVFYPDLQIATERLLMAIRTILEFIERLTGASSYVMGKESEVVGGSGTATRTQAIVGAAEQRFAIPAQRLREGVSRIQTILLDQVQKFIPPGLETRVLGEKGEPLFHANELTKEGISGEYDAYILEDASMGSTTVERELATLLYNVLMNNPIVASDPVKIYKETAKFLKAYKQDPTEHLGKLPEEVDIDEPEDENTMIVQGDFKKVRAIMTENHLQHVMKHQLLPQSPTMTMMQIQNPELAGQVLQFVQGHMQEHMQFMQQMMAVQAQFGNQGGQQGGQQSGQANSKGTNQGASNAQGVENLPGPFGAVANTKREGQSQFSPSP